MKSGTLKPKYGYWDTTYYPIGGAFRRAGNDGLYIIDIEPMDSPYKGSNATGRTQDGQRVAFNTENLED